MSCNPAIGGLGKGHIVREIDALDGVMGRAADQAGIQFRLLNRSKGPAVQGPRTQADRALYRAAVQAEFAARPGPDGRRGRGRRPAARGGRRGRRACWTAVRALRRARGRADHRHLPARRDPHRRAPHARPAGSATAPAVRLAERIDDLGLPLGRLKTGTPPRLDGRSIDWERLEHAARRRRAGALLVPVDRRRAAPQIACGITHTNERTHDIIRRNISRSAIYGGRIDGRRARATAPRSRTRWCASPTSRRTRSSWSRRGWTTTTVYPNGISTSLPRTCRRPMSAPSAGSRARG